ncbi:unnamed protein product, partial [Medioppia subpectinata]
MLKKYPNIDGFEIEERYNETTEQSINSDIIELFIKYIPRLDSINFWLNHTLSSKTRDKLFAKFGKQLKTIESYEEDSAGVSANIQLCPNLQTLDLTQTLEMWSSDGPLRLFSQHLCAENEILFPKLKTFRFRYTAEDSDRFEGFVRNYKTIIKSLYINIDYNCDKQSFDNLMDCLPQIVSLNELSISVKAVNHFSSDSFAVQLKQLGLKCRQMISLSIHMPYTQTMWDLNPAPIMPQTMSIITNSSRDNYYDETFDVNLQSIIGSGFFTTVYRVRHRTDGQTYAVKQITLSRLDEKQKSNAMKESDFLVKINPKMSVKYIDSWIEGNTFLYIQMEACDQSLRPILETKYQAFGRQSAKEPLKCHEWYLSCHIYRELLECVKSLHDMSPQLIHRDLKPENVLIQRQASGQWCLKLCDFGLSTLHDDEINYRTSQKHTADVGTPKYIAHEVMTGRKYGPKADVYSLAIIGGELFDICVPTIDLTN